MKTITLKGSTFTSTYDDDGAVHRLRELVDQNRVTSDFARSLANQSRTRRLSVNQIPWVHKIVTEQEAAQPPDDPCGLAARRILDAARAKGLTKPILRVAVVGPTIRLGFSTRSPSLVTVTRDRVYECSIKPDGTLTRRPHDEVLVVLALIEKDPREVATLHGRKTNQCCFCGRHLETAESVSAGYGPVCADRWGLPWGDVPDEWRGQPSLEECVTPNEEDLEEDRDMHQAEQGW